VISREVRTQAELDAAIAAGEQAVIVGGARLAAETKGTASPWFKVLDGFLQLLARESSQPRVEAWGSSQPSVVARESSQPRVVAWGSSQPSVVANGCTQLQVRGAVAVVAAATVAILVTGGTPKIDGGGFVQRVNRDTPAAWCGYHGVEVRGGIALVYKAVNKDFRSERGGDYTPGKIPAADGWNDLECSSGLHFSPTPGHAQAFFRDAGVRFVACPVALADMMVHPNGAYPEKCKAKRMAATGWEVTIDGDPVPGAVVAWPEVVQAETPKKKRPKAPAARRKAVRK